MSGAGRSLQVVCREVEVVAVGVVPDLLTVEEAARVLRISRATAYKEARRYLATGGKEGLPVILVGGVLRVPRILLEAMIGGPIREIPAPGGTGEGGAGRRGRPPQSHEPHAEAHPPDEDRVAHAAPDRHRLRPR